MEWIVALLILLAGLATLPVMLRAAKKSMRGKGRMAAISMAIGLGFSAILDPPSKAASEEIEKNKGSRRQENADGYE